MKHQPILLASSSPYRRSLLQKLNLEFEWANPNIDEQPQPNENANALTARLAEQKAKALGAQFPQHLIIGSDQVASFNGKIIGKPHTHTAATAQLRQFRENELQF